MPAQFLRVFSRTWKHHLTNAVVLRARLTTEPLGLGGGVGKEGSDRFMNESFFVDFLFIFESTQIDESTRSSVKSPHGLDSVCGQKFDRSPRAHKSSIFAARSY